MEATALPEPATQPRHSRRLLIILLLGVIAVGISLGVRRSDWAQERRLRTLSLEELALAIHDTPNEALTFVYYGSGLLKAGYLEASQRAFEQAIKLDPKMERAHLGLATAQFHRGDLKSALSSFERAIKLDPREPIAYLGLAQAYHRAGSPKRAIEPLKKVVELQPENALAWYQLGKMYGDARQSDLAFEALQRAVKLDPKKADFWRDLGRLSQHYSRLEEAEKQFKQAVRLNRSDPITYYWLGQLYSQMGDTPKLRGSAEHVLLAAVNRDPTMPEAYFELGRLYERRENWSLAAVNYRKARELDPSDEKSLYHLGLCLVKLGDTAKGQELIRGAQALSKAKREVQTLENRIRSEPDTRPLRLRLARLYRKYGNPAGALDQYAAYQRLGPHDPAIDRETATYRAQAAPSRSDSDKFPIQQP